MDIIRDMLNTLSFNDSDRRPKNWREMILYLYPNAQSPLTALTALMGSESVTDPEFYWWEKDFPEQIGTITGVYTEATLSSAYNPANAAALAAAGSTLYLKMAAADASKFRTGHVIMMRDISHPAAGIGILGEVTSVTVNGASSALVVKLHQADFSVTAAHVPGTFDHGYLEFLSGASGIAWVAGNWNAEGAAAPSSIVYEPTKVYNFTQIFRTPLSMTRTAKKTRLRTGDQVAQAKKEALELHGIEMEKNFIFGLRQETTDAVTGNPKRMTAGLLNMLDAGGSRVVSQNVFSGTWGGSAGTGWTWLQTQLMSLFAKGSNARIALCGPSALLGLTQLTEQIGGQIQISDQASTIGMSFTKVKTPFGDLLLKQHPLFSAQTGLHKAMMCLDPANIKYRYLDDTTFNAAIQDNDIDGDKSEYLTEAGLEIHHGSTHRFLDNIG